MHAAPSAKPQVQLTVSLLRAWAAVVSPVPEAVSGCGASVAAVAVLELMTSLLDCLALPLLMLAETHPFLQQHVDFLTRKVPCAPSHLSRETQTLAYPQHLPG